MSSREKSPQIDIWDIVIADRIENRVLDYNGACAHGDQQQSSPED